MKYMTEQADINSKAGYYVHQLLQVITPATQYAYERTR